MKKLLFIITTLLVITSCATTNETGLSKSELRNEKKLAEQETVKKAVESRRFIVKFDKIYFSHGGIVDLLPRSNYIIIDGEKAVISAAYLGRQWDIKPISGINVIGRTQNYELKNTSKGMYEIKMKVSRDGNSFDIFLTISKNGSCSASLSSMRIENVRYRGQIVPIKDKINNPPQETIMI